MLNKIIILNSKIYAKAVVLLNAPSIQMVANNNTGKSSFINTLNFLFIINKRNMEFGDHEWKETLNHYFPSPNTSCILFEIWNSGKGYYCILVNRNINSDDINYYIIEREWEFLDKIFFLENGELINFQDIRKKLTIDNIDFKEVKRDELFEKVYSPTAVNRPIVQITSNVKRKGRSTENTFTKVYRYLISPQSIDSEALKDALITADNRQYESLVVFSDSSHKDNIVTIKKHNEEIRSLKSIERNFKIFKQTYHEYCEKKKTLGQIYYLFKRNFDFQYKQLTIQINFLKTENSNIQQKIDSQLETLVKNLNGEIAVIQYKAEEAKRNVEHLQKNENDVNKIIVKYGSMEFALSSLNQKISQLKDEILDIESQLNNIEKHNLSQSMVEEKLRKYNKRKEGLQLRLGTYEDSLLTHFSEDVECQRFLNTIFSTKISSLNKDKITRPISEPISSFDILTIYGGSIDISGIELSEIETIEEIQQELVEIERDVRQWTETLRMINNRNIQERILKNKEVELQRTFEKGHRQCSAFTPIVVTSDESYRYK